MTQRKKLRGYRYQDQRRPSRQPRAAEVPTGVASGLQPEPTFQEEPKKKATKTKKAKNKAKKPKKKGK